MAGRSRLTRSGDGRRDCWELDLGCRNLDTCQSSTKLTLSGSGWWFVSLDGLELAEGRGDSVLAGMQDVTRFQHLDGLKSEC
jgi:hypothetical protein